MTQETDAKYKQMQKKKITRLLKSYRGFIGWTIVALLLISYLGVVVPPNTYIKCDDPSISHEVKTDTISVPTLLSVCLLVPFVTITLAEYLLAAPSSGTHSRFKSGFKRSRDYLCTLLVWELFSFFLVEILKTSVSEARPHFLTTCKPNFTTEQCSSTWVPVTLHDCTNPQNVSRRKLLDAMKSFPSGHACLGIFTAVFMSVYTHMRLQVAWSRLLPWVLQLLWWIWGLMCCISRVWDFKHFWWDVAVGGIIGGIVSYASVAYVCNWFEEDKYSNEVSETYQEVREAPLLTPNGNGAMPMSRSFIVEESQRTRTNL